MMSRWLLDTNLLVRSADHQSENHDCAVAALLELYARGDEVYVCNQSLFEFWVVATRPVERNGLGLSLANTDHLLDEFIEDYLNLPDPEGIVSEWRRLVFCYQIRSFKAHDMRLAAYARLHGIPRILTFNTADFKPVSREIEAVSPTDFLAYPTVY